MAPHLASLRSREILVVDDLLGLDMLSLATSQSFYYHGEAEDATSASLQHMDCEIVIRFRLPREPQCTLPRSSSACAQMVLKSG